jgi:nucleosome binding factor SPN SPT16 subunit
MQADKTTQVLRINFHNPNQATKDIVLPSASEHNLFIKELTFRAGEGGKNILQVYAELREALRVVKQQDSMTHKSADAKEEDTHLA